MEPNLEPRKRSKLRLVLGITGYRFLRYRQWFLSGTKFALTKENPDSYKFRIADHATPLYRQLSNTDLWLQRNKVVNLTIAISKLNRIVLKPGQVFSFWRLVGRTTRRKGYMEGMILFNGQVKPGVGGGLCQLSNLIYWMTLHTPLTVTERWRHSYDVFPDSSRSQPFGSGATISYNHIDLQIKNTTDQDFILSLYLAGDSLVGEWRSNRPVSDTYEVYEKEHKITHELWGGYVRRNKLYRYIYNESKVLIADELVAENHAIMMYQPFLTGGQEGEG